MKRAIKECHSFFQKERCGRGTPFFREGAGAERHSKNMGALNTLLSIADYDATTLINVYIPGKQVHGCGKFTYLKGLM